MDEVDGWLIIGCLALLAAAVIVVGRRTDVLRRDVDFLRIVVQETDAAKAD